MHRAAPRERGVQQPSPASLATGARGGSSRADGGRSRGFTLIELLITLVVVAILAAIAYPSYESYTKRGRRSQAEQLVSQVASREEEYMLDAHAYTTTLGTGGLNLAADGWTCAATCTNSYYTVSVATQAGPPPGYTVTAQAQGSQASDGNLTLTSDGSKSRSAGDGSW